jgi:hypothetical protein
MIQVFALLSGLLGRLALRLGRRGGVVLLIAGLVSAASGVWLLAVDLRLAAALLGAAPVLLGMGLLVRFGPTARRSPSSDAALSRALAQDRPLRLCLDCRLEVGGPRCPSCQKSSSCFEVQTDADRQNARGLLGLSP